jgi:hypothetical protein
MTTMDSQARKRAAARCRARLRKKRDVYMTRKGLFRKALVILPTIAAAALLAPATAPAASADSMRTFNFQIICGTGEAYGLEIWTPATGWYQPTSGSSYVVGNSKFFTVPISASATSIEITPLSCAGEPFGSGGGPYPEGYTYAITAGTSTINANAYTQDYNFDGVLLFYTSLSNISYS